MANEETTARNDWYGVTAYPTMFVDGVDAGWPYDPNWVDSLTHHMTIDSPLDFTIGGEYNPDTHTGTFEVEVNVVGTLRPGADYRIVYVLAEDGFVSGGNTYDETVHDIIPAPNATPVTIEQGNTYTFTTDFSVRSGWNAENCFIAVFIQDWGSKWVLQAGKEWIMELEPLAEAAVEVSSTSLDFGSVEVGQQANLPLALYSTGDIPVVLSNIHANNLSFTTNWNPEDSLIAVGDSLIVTVTFAPIAAVEFHRALIIESNADLVNVGLNGIGTPATAVDPNPGTIIPRTFALNAPYPNPFNPETMVSFDLPTTSDVSFVVYDIQGRRVANLGNGRYQAGRYSITFQAGNLSSGVYFIRMEAAGRAFTRKCLLIR